MAVSMYNQPIEQHMAQLPWDAFSAQRAAEQQKFNQAREGVGAIRKDMLLAQAHAKDVQERDMIQAQYEGQIADLATRAAAGDSNNIVTQLGNLKYDVDKDLTQGRLGAMIKNLQAKQEYDKSIDANKESTAEQRGLLKAQAENAYQGIGEGKDGAYNTYAGLDAAKFVERTNVLNEYAKTIPPVVKQYIDDWDYVDHPAGGGLKMWKHKKSAQTTTKMPDQVAKAIAKAAMEHEGLMGFEEQMSFLKNPNLTPEERTKGIEQSIIESAKNIAPLHERKDYIENQDAIKDDDISHARYASSLNAAPEEPTPPGIEIIDEATEAKAITGKKLKKIQENSTNYTKNIQETIKYFTDQGFPAESDSLNGTKYWDALEAIAAQKGIHESVVQAKRQVYENNLNYKALAEQKIQEAEIAVGWTPEFRTQMYKQLPAVEGYTNKEAYDILAQEKQSIKGVAGAKASDIESKMSDDDYNKYEAAIALESDKKEQMDKHLKTKYINKTSTTSTTKLPGYDLMSKADQKSYTAMKTELTKMLNDPAAISNLVLSTAGYEGETLESLAKKNKLNLNAKAGEAGYLKLSGENATISLVPNSKGEYTWIIPAQIEKKPVHLSISVDQLKIEGIKQFMLTPMFKANSTYAMGQQEGVENFPAPLLPEHRVNIDYKNGKIKIGDMLYEKDQGLIRIADIYKLQKFGITEPKLVTNFINLRNAGLSEPQLERYLHDAITN